MNTAYQNLEEELKKTKRTWLITGVAGFIGSNLLERLLKLDQRVVGLDNFSTGHKKNIEDIRSLVSHDQWSNFYFIEGNICNLNDCILAMKWRHSVDSTVNSSEEFPVEFVLHQAALGSVPRSIADPITTNRTNIEGFLNTMIAARNARVTQFVYAASSSTYGDHALLPKVEERIGKPLSPYAVTKLVNELYADIFSRCYAFNSIGLRYFNVFGPRQDPYGSYAAVIPKWAISLMRGEDICINGDGETSRDFCFVENVVQANILASMTSNPDAKNQIFNIALGEKTTLNKLYELMSECFTQNGVVLKSRLIYGKFRDGDVPHSLASVEKAEKLLEYKPVVRIKDGLQIAIQWYLSDIGVTH